MFKFALLGLCSLLIVACAKSSKDRKLSTSAGKGKVKTIQMKVYGASTDKVSSASVYLTDFDKEKEFQAFFVEKEESLHQERIDNNTDKVTINLTARKITKKKGVFGDQVNHYINRNMNLNVKVVKLNLHIDFDLITLDYLENYNPAILVSQINFDADDDFRKWSSASLKEKHIEFDHRRHRELSQASSSDEYMSETQMADLVQNMTDEESSNGAIFWVTKTIPLKNKNEKRIFSYVVKLEDGFNQVSKGKIGKDHIVTVSYKVLESEIVKGK